MSGLVNNPAQPRHSQSDARINRMNFMPERLFADIWFCASASFVSPWWPTQAGFVGDLGAEVGLLCAEQWGEFDQAAGSASRFGFTGVTRDQWGTAVGTVTVNLFRTSDNVLVDSSISDPSGNFLLNTAYYPDTHYIVAHKSGSPDVDGATVNTLIGA